MGFLSLIIALLVEQVRPLATANVAYNAVRGLAEVLERNFNAGEKQHGVLAWMVLVAPMTAFPWLVFYLLVRVHPFLGLAWNALILYLTLGFRQFSHYYTDIQMALANNDLDRARALLTEWRRASDPRFSAADLTLSEICRLTLEEALIASHRHVFGVFFWFVILPGPAGAVLYRLADYLARSWSRPGVYVPLEPFGMFARRVFQWIDWLPVRFTAIGFAIVGNFEDALFNWRNHAEPWEDPSRGILIAAGSGALGVRLGPVARPVPVTIVPVDDDPTLVVDPTEAVHQDPLVDAMPGVDASPAALRSGVGLVWRSLLLWMLLLLLLSLAGWAG